MLELQNGIYNYAAAESFFIHFSEIVVTRIAWNIASKWIFFPVQQAQAGGVGVYMRIGTALD